MTLFILPAVQEPIDREIWERFGPIFNAIERQDEEAIVDALIACRPGTPDECDCRSDGQSQEPERKLYWTLRHCFESQYCSSLWVELHGFGGDIRLLLLTRVCLYRRMQVEKAAGNDKQAKYLLELHGGLLALDQSDALAWRESCCSE